MASNWSIGVFGPPITDSHTEVRFLNPNVASTRYERPDPPTVKALIEYQALRFRTAVGSLTVDKSAGARVELGEILLEWARLVLSCV